MKGEKVSQVKMEKKKPWDSISRASLGARVAEMRIVSYSQKARFGADEATKVSWVEEH